MNSARFAATFLCVAGVPVFVVLLVRLCFAEPISSFRPSPNDELTYWHQAATFSHVGFRGGYYTLGEVINASGVTPFGPHGPGFAVLYGSVGAIFGWHRHSVVLLNLAIIALATWLFLTINTLSTARIWLCAVLLVTFWPLLFWAPTGMQEGLHHAGAIGMAGFFAHALGPRRRIGVLASGWIVLSILAFIRPSWLVLMPLWALANAQASGTRMKVAWVTGSMLLAVTIYWAYNATVAPYPAGFFFLRVANLDVGLDSVATNLADNLRRTLAIFEYEPFEVWHRAQYWAWLIAASVLFALGIVSYRRMHVHRELDRYLVFGLAAMTVALALMLGIYTLTNWAEHRVLSAFLLFATLLSVASPARAPAVLVVALVMSNLLGTGVFLEAFRQDRRDHFISDPRPFRAFEEAIAGKLVYQPGASRWCNTLLTAQRPPYLTAVPPGIGLSIVREADNLALPPRSRYLLLDERARSELRGPVRMQPLADFPFGTLYLNLEAQCS